MARQIIVPQLIKGADLRPGMVLYSGPEMTKKQLDTNSLPKVTGMCAHGFHFGNACYDFIGIWWTPVKVFTEPIQQLDGPVPDFWLELDAAMPAAREFVNRVAPFIE